jgi:hypothetical protein
MGLPHWLMIAGAVLVVIGFLGLAFARDNQDQTDPVANEGSVPKPEPPAPSPQMPGQPRLLDSSHNEKADS